MLYNIAQFFCIYAVSPIFAQKLIVKETTKRKSGPWESDFFIRSQRAMLLNLQLGMASIVSH